MTVSNRLAVRVHTGTTEAVGEVVVLDAEGLEPGSTGLVQLRLESPLVAAPGDRFVLRLASPSITLGGGVLIERSRHRLKRFKQFALEELKRQSDGLGSVSEFLEVTLARREPGLVSITELAVQGQRSAKEAAESLEALELEGLVRSFEGGKRWVHSQVFDKAVEQICLELEGWFEERPWRMRAEAIAVRSRTSLSAPFFDVLLKAAVERGLWMQHPGGKVSSPGREPQLGEGEEAVLERLCDRMQRAEFQPPGLEELEAEVGLSHDRVEALMELLVDQDRIHHVGAGVFLSETSMSRAREAVRSNCEENGELDIPTLRDQLGTTRKFLIPLLEHFDATGLTVRAGANRVLKRR